MTDSPSDQWSAGRLGRPLDPAVHDVLVTSQRLGFLGDRAIEEAVEHARSFVRAVESAETVGTDGASGGAGPLTIIDLGAGGGLPGLVIAHDLRGVRLVLLDRRAKRTDFLERMVSRIGWSDRVTVVCDDAERHQPAALVDVVVARGFGPPEHTVLVAARLVRPGGLIVISEPPGEDRWASVHLDDLGVVRVSPPGDPVVRFRRH